MVHRSNINYLAACPRMFAMFCVLTGLCAHVWPVFGDQAKEENVSKNSHALTPIPQSLQLKVGDTWRRFMITGETEEGFHLDLSSQYGLSSLQPDFLDFMNGKWVARQPGIATLALQDDQGNTTREIKVEILDGPEQLRHPTFVDDIQPILTKVGCNNGACHAKPGGRNGFELSVFGYAPEIDHREIVQDNLGRRIFPASPENSLLLLKATGAVKHEGGSPLVKDSEFYQILVTWIESGMPYENKDAPKLNHIEVAPAGGRLKKGSSFNQAVWAHYDDGSIRDVSHLAEYQSTDRELLEIDDHGHATAHNRDGQVVVVTRFSGLIAESRWMIPRNDNSSVSDPDDANIQPYNFIDKHAFAYLKELGYRPSELCSDSEFIRRSSLDAAGVLPTPEETRAFLEDPSPDKRQRWIQRLMKHRWIGDYWANQWTDLLRPNPDRAGIKSVYMFDQWVRECFRANMPYDQFVRSILTLEGSNHQAGPASIYRDKRTPEDLTVLFSQLFLGVRLECAKCHHHPFEKWGQEDFYQTAAFFGSVKQKGAGVSPPISAGTETFYFRKGGSVQHPRTEEVMHPTPPGGKQSQIEEGIDPRGSWMDWMMDPENPYFAQAIVNRVWNVFFGKGFVNPVDDFRTSNPPVHDALMQALARDFVEHGYNLRHLMSTIMTSRLYQSSSNPNETNLTDTRYFSRYYRKRLPAEVLQDAVTDVTEIEASFEGLPPGSRAIETWNFKIESQFMDAFDRPNSSSDPPCERINKPSVVQSLHMMHSEGLQSKLQSDKGWIESLMRSGMNHSDIIDAVYLKIFSRYPDADERDIAEMTVLGENQRQGLEDLVWALLNSAEFIFNH